MFSRKIRGAIINLAILTSLGGLIWSFFVKQNHSLTHQVVLTMEQWRTIKETLLVERSNSDDQQILKMIGFDLNRVGVCFDCKEFQEWNSGSVYTTYPVIGHHIKQGEKRYVLVVGQIGWHAGQPTKMYAWPKSAIYILEENRVYRIAEEVTYTDNSPYWMHGRVNHVSVEDKMRREAIAALQRPIIERF